MVIKISSIFYYSHCCCLKIVVFKFLTIFCRTCPNIASVMFPRCCTLHSISPTELEARTVSLESIEVAPKSVRNYDR